MGDKVYRVVDGRPLPDLDSGNLILDEDGDKLDITFNPSNSVPDASIPEADDVDDLAAHLKGIDTALMMLGSGNINIKSITWNTDTSALTKCDDDILKDFDITVDDATDKVFFIVSFYVKLSTFNGEYEIDFQRRTSPAGDIKKMHVSNENGLHNFATTVVDTPGSVGSHTYRIYADTASFCFKMYVVPSIIIAIVFNDT